jgi:hypothetical protein
MSALPDMGGRRDVTGATAPGGNGGSSEHAEMLQPITNSSAKGVVRTLPPTIVISDIITSFAAIEPIVIAEIKLKKVIWLISFLPIIRASVNNTT